MNRILIILAIIAVAGCVREPKATVDYPADQLVDPITEQAPTPQVRP